jgi:hypothetical protein
MKHFVPPEFIVPNRLEHALFMLRPLLITDVVKDYDAVMTSVRHLQGVFGPHLKWPSPDLTFEQDLIDLGWHHKEFQRRTSFAYTMMTRDDSQCLGCAYIYPTSIDGYDAEVYCWVRSSHATALDAVLFAALQAWLKRAWPFQRAAFPGRELAWQTGVI